MEALGDRMKAYEKVTRYQLIRRTPVIIRLDGRAFHTFTRGCKRPFDAELIETMWRSALGVTHDMQGCKLAFIQSDEASFLLCDWDDINTEPWFGNGLSKILSISASVMTAHFNKNWGDYTGPLAIFDSRAFQLPRDEVANYFLWRAKDWERNSLQMYCQSIFSHRELHGKKKEDMHEMLHEQGKNWTTDLLPVERNGTWIWKDERATVVNHSVLPRFEDVSKVVENVMPKEETEQVQRKCRPESLHWQRRITSRLIMPQS